MVNNHEIQVEKIKTTQDCLKETQRQLADLAEQRWRLLRSRDELIGASQLAQAENEGALHDVQRMSLQIDEVTQEANLALNRELEDYASLLSEERKTNE